MAMQDKDFDKLFKQKFEGFEEEPSSRVWDNIAAQLDGKKGRRSLIPWISIAAAVLIIATAGALFFKADTQTRQNNKLVSKPVKAVAPVEAYANDTSQAEAVTAPAPVVAKTTLPTRHKQSQAVAVTTSIIPVAVTPADIVEHDPTIADESIIAGITNPASATTVAALPDVSLAPRTIDADEQTGLTSAEQQQTEPVKKRGIHNLGGLINAVVAKLDKRDDKLIEFSDGDEGDENVTTVTGVNLGLIKIKKQ
jgi:cytoskeletal protein RodZ